MRPIAPAFVSGACALALLLAPPVEAAGDASLSSGANAIHVKFLLTSPLPEVLHWRLDYLLAEVELEELVPPELLRMELQQGTVSLR